MLCIRFHNLFLFLSLSITSLLFAAPKEIQYKLSPSELNIISQNPATEYIYFDKSVSNLSDIVFFLSNIDDRNDSPLYQLRKHIEEGFVIGEINTVLDILEYANALLQKNYKKMDIRQAERIAIVLSKLIDQITDGNLTIDVSSLKNDFDSDGYSEQYHSKKHSNNDCFVCCPRVDKINVNVRGRARFQKDAFFKENVTIRGKLKVFDDAKFKEDVTVKGDLFVGGTFSAVDIAVNGVISVTDLIITENLFLDDSTDSENGNILKNGDVFIQNFGVENTFIGINAGNFTLTGSQNVGLGDGALDSLTTGSDDIAIGAGALGLLTTGSDDIAIGSGAGAALTSASRTINIGTRAGQALTTDPDIINIGSDAGSALGLITHTDAINIGSNAGAGLLSVLKAVNIGKNAGRFVPAAADLINIGSDAGSAVAAVSHTDVINIGSNAGAGLLSVLKATNIGTNAGRFVPAAAGLINIGSDAGSAIAAVSHTDVINIGNNAGAALTSASKVINIGTRAGQALTASADIINIGSDAGASLAAISDVINIGSNAGTALTTGSGNINIGHNAGATATTSSRSTAVGSGALQFNIADDNTAFGRRSLRNNTSGTGNVAVGSDALDSLDTGSNNIGIGFGAGAALNLAESNDIYIGNTGVAAESNTIRIGALGTQIACFIQGISGATTGGAAVAVLVDAAGQLGTISSSANVKHDVQDMGNQSANILNLRPVTFVYNNDTSETPQYGLIAEEVKEVFSDIVVNDKDGKPFTVQYHVLPVLLLNEVKKQHTTIEHMNEVINNLRAEVQECIERVKNIENIA